MANYYVAITVAFLVVTLLLYCIHRIPHKVWLNALMGDRLRPSDMIPALYGFLNLEEDIVANDDIDERLLEGLSLGFAVRETKSIENIVDLSRCPLGTPLSLFIYDDPDPVISRLRQSEYAIDSPYDACLFIALIREGQSPQSLPHWRNHGRNHLLIYRSAYVNQSKIGQAMVMRQIYNSASHRPGIDMVGYSDLATQSIDYWNTRTSISDSRKRRVCLVVERAFASDHQSIDTTPSRVECAASASSCSRQMRKCTFVILAALPTLPLRILDALKSGSIPVVLSLAAPLPFEDAIDWSTALLRSPLSRVDQLPAYLRSISIDEIMERRRMGRVLLDMYFDHSDGFARGLIETISARFHVGLAKPFPYRSSPFFTDNTTKVFNDKKSRLAWRLPIQISPLSLNQPYLPEPTNSLVMEVAGNWRTEEVFRENLGGSLRSENFTIVILTFDRDANLKQMIRAMNGINFLQKIVVVWNNPDRIPSVDWPNIHVPVEFIKSPSNSLNSRFIPFDRIETDAILSLDDDIYTTHEEIELAFRVWRENRNRLVGFLARRHSTTNGSQSQIAYRTNPIVHYDYGWRCDHSMIMTGFAFLHRAYLFEYTYRMSEAIRAYVDENRNCEDIAMNFLVAHKTRTGPIRVGSKMNWEFPTHTTGLHTTSGHYQRRSACMQYFTRVYGYNPLVVSQYTVHSSNFNAKNGPTCMKDI